MDSRIVTCIVPSLVLGAWFCAPFGAFAQEGGRGGAAQPARIENPQSLAHTDAAERSPVTIRSWGWCGSSSARCAIATSLGAEIEAMKVFDNLYAIPSSSWQQTTAWAIPTSEGIILLDSGEKGKTENIVAGLRKVGSIPPR